MVMMGARSNDVRSRFNEVASSPNSQPAFLRLSAMISGSFLSAVCGADLSMPVVFRAAAKIRSLSHSSLSPGRGRLISSAES